MKVTCVVACEDAVSLLGYLGYLLLIVDIMGVKPDSAFCVLTDSYVPLPLIQKRSIVLEKRVSFYFLEDDSVYKIQQLDFRCKMV